MPLYWPATYVLMFWLLNVHKLTTILGVKAAFSQNSPKMAIFTKTNSPLVTKG